MRHRHLRSIAVASTFLLGGLLAVVVPASASTVTYTTSGVFSIGGGTVFSGTGGAKLTFGNGSGNVTVPPLSTGTMGTFTTSIPNGKSITGNGTFTLTIHQTSPSAGTSSFASGAFSGTLSKNSFGANHGQLIITFSQPSISIAGVTYTLEGLGGANLAADQLGISSGTTTLQADITTPEPTLYSLIGIGLVALVAVGLKRRQVQAS